MTKIDHQVEVPGYRLIRRIGAGGMSVVYLAVQKSLKREVALKIMRPQIHDDTNVIKRFEQEAELIAQLYHPNIVNIYEFGHIATGEMYYSMPYLPDGDLSEFVWDSDEELIEILAGVCDGLAYAHTMGVVHRDIKPENILFDPLGMIKIADFGIALSLESKRFTRDDRIVGSIHYMSPEQAQSKAIDARSDVYGVGAILYELLTGDPVFDEDNDLAIMMAHVSKPVPKLPDQWCHWQPVIDRCLAKNPGQRFQNMEVLKNAIRAVEVPLPRGHWYKVVGLWLLLPLLLLIWTVFQVWEAAPEQGEPETAEVTEFYLPQPLETESTEDQEPGDDAEPIHQIMETWLADLDSIQANQPAILAAWGQQFESVDNALTAGDIPAAEMHATQMQFWRQLVKDSDETFISELLALEASQWSKIKARLTDISADELLAWQSNLAPDSEPPKVAAVEAKTTNQKTTDALGVVWVSVPTGLQVARTEITWRLYDQFVTETARDVSRCKSVSKGQFKFSKRSYSKPGFKVGDDQPVVCVSWEDARDFAAWHSRKTGLESRLPTANEWRQINTLIDQPACGQHNVAGRERNPASQFKCDDGQLFVNQVTRFSHNKLGLIGWHGNVSEWLSACEKTGKIGALIRPGRKCESNPAAGLSWASETPQDGGIKQMKSGQAWSHIGIRLVRNKE